MVSNSSKELVEDNNPATEAVDHTSPNVMNASEILVELPNPCKAASPDGIEIRVHQEERERRDRCIKARRKDRDLGVFIVYYL